MKLIIPTPQHRCYQLKALVNDRDKVCIVYFNIQVIKIKQFMLQDAFKPHTFHFLCANSSMKIMCQSQNCEFILNT